MCTTEALQYRYLEILNDRLGLGAKAQQGAIHFRAHELNMTIPTYGGSDPQCTSVICMVTTAADPAHTATVCKEFNDARRGVKAINVEDCGIALVVDLLCGHEDALPVSDALVAVFPRALGLLAKGFGATADHLNFLEITASDSEGAESTTRAEGDR